MKTFRFALKQVAPLSFSYIFVGIAFGILMFEAGYAPLWSLLAGFFIYAGSMQIVMISLVGSGASLPLVAVMTFFINARHIFYGIGFIQRFQKQGWKYPYMILTLTDETYSVLSSLTYPEDIDPIKGDFYVALICHMVWTGSCLVGALVGQLIPFDMTGIDFSATVFFVTICVDQWQRFGSRIPAISGLVSGILLFFLVGKDNFILPALSVSMVVLALLKDRVLLQMRGQAS